MKRQLKQTINGVGLPFLLFFVFLALSQSGRWDFIYASAEVDLRSWLYDLIPPQWSYQLCGGITRIGDAASWGLSPWFIFVIALGPVWGTKFIVLGSALVGFIFMKKILTLFLKSGDPRKELTKRHDQLLTLLSLMFVFGFGFLWKFNRGQIAYASLYLAIPVIHYTLKVLSTKLNWKQFVLAVFWTWSFYSGPFPTGTLYLLLPFFVSLFLWLGFRWAHDPAHFTRPLLEDIGRMASFHVVGLGLAYYRVTAVFHELRELPSGFPMIRDNGNPFKSLVHQILPTIGDRYLGFFNIPDRGGAVEFAAFTLIPIWILVYTVVHLYKKDRSEFHETESADDELATNHLDSFLWIFGIVLFMHLLGDRGGIFPHRVFDKILFNHTVRGIGAYQITLTFLLALLLVQMLRKDVSFQLIARKSLYWPTLIILCLGFFTFEKPKAMATRLADAIKIYPTRGTQLRAFAIPKAVDRFPLYRNVAAGVGVLGCSTFSLLSPTSAESPRRDVSDDNGLPTFMVSAMGKKIPTSCIEKSYFTQRSIVLDASCPQDLCVNIGANSPKDRGVWKWNPALLRYCR